MATATRVPSSSLSILDDFQVLLDTTFKNHDENGQVRLPRQQIMMRSPVNFVAQESTIDLTPTAEEFNQDKVTEFSMPVS